MSENKSKGTGKRALTALITLSLSVMMLPAAAFADEFDSIIESDTYYDSDTRGIDDETFELSVIADNNQTQSGSANSITTDNAGVLAKANHDGTAQAIADGTVTTGGSGVVAYARNGGVATISTGNVNSESEGAVGAYATAWYENSQTWLFLEDVSAGAGVRAESNDKGSTDFTAGNVSATKGDAGNFNANSFSSNRSSQTNATLKDVSSVTCGLVVTARNKGTTTVKADNVSAKDTGIISSNSGGTIDIAVKNITAAKSALSLRDLGGQSTIKIDGDATSSEFNGLVYVDMSNGTGKDTVLITGTLSGATNGVVADNKSQALDLTVWKIEAKDGKIVANDDANDSFAKAIKYIVKMEQPIAGGILSATKADGSVLETSQGYSVAKEGDKVLLNVKLEEGYSIIGAYNGLGEQVELLKDENGNYYIIVPRGGGIYLSVMLAQDDVMNFVNPSEDASGATITPASATPVTPANNSAEETKTAPAKVKATPASSTAPKTGDDSPLLPAGVILLFALFACATAQRMRHDNDAR